MLKVGSQYSLKIGIVVKCIGELKEPMGPQELKFILTNSPKEDGGFFVKADGTHILDGDYSVEREVHGEYSKEYGVGDSIVLPNGMFGMVVYRDLIGQVLRTKVRQENEEYEDILYPFPLNQEAFVVKE